MLNRIELIGNLGNDPDQRDANGTPVSEFSVATTTRWKNKKGEKQERTEWHRVVAFGRLAEICNDFLRKGSRVFVAGELRYEKWEDKHGENRITAKVYAEDMRMLDTKGSRGDREGDEDRGDHRGSRTKAPGRRDDDFGFKADDDDVPF